MKKFLFFLTLLTFFYQELSAQDVTFSQWENFPVHFNPALTGNFEGSLRFRAKHRNQWRSLLGKNSYRISAASAEYKFKTGNKRQFSLGFHTIFDKAGASSFKTKTFNLSSSLVQKLNVNHGISLGFNAGWGHSSIDLDNLSWGNGDPVEPEDFNFNSELNFLDISAGLNWQYTTKNHLSFQLGSALHHVNRPNVSLIQNSDNRLPFRFNLHGNVEIPLANKFSLVPSFLFVKRGIESQELLGLSNKWYFKSTDNNFVQVGLFVRSANHFDGTAFDIYVFSVSLEADGILYGFSFDRFQRIGRNAFEFSAGYTLNSARK